MKRLFMRGHGKSHELKSLGIVLLMLVLVLALAGCNKSSAPSADKPASAPTSATPTKASLATVGGPDASLLMQLEDLRPWVTTWQVSSHSQMGCENCHKGLDESALKEAQKSGRMPKVEKVTADACKGCHSANRYYSLPGNLNAAHERHDEKGIGCMNCHASVVHAGIKGRTIMQQPGFADYAAWDEDVAKQAATRTFVRPNKWETCIPCHSALKVGTKCGACHTGHPGLASHDEADFLVTHGVIGRRNIDGCSRCHANKEGPATIDSRTGDVIADFAQGTPFCYQCHKTRPAGHESNFLPKHSSKAGSKGIGNCFTCHSIAQPSSEQKVTSTFCNQCHWFPTKERAKPEPQPEAQAEEAASGN